jgi:transcriptional regulator with XRE-family HTH domain
MPPTRTASPPAPLSDAQAEAPAHRINSIIDMWLGEQLRRRRKALDKPLRQVAQASGISVSLLSQVERGLRSISLRTLNALALELDLPLETLIRNSQPHEHDAAGAVVRAGHHPRIDLADKGIEKVNLTPPAAKGSVQMYRALIAPGGSTGDELFFTHPGEQVGYVVQGQLELCIQDQLLRLNCGDSFCYDSSTPRRWCNPGTTETIVMWGVTQSGK